MNSMDHETFKKEYNKDISFVRSTFLGRPMTVSFASLYLFEKVLLEYPVKRIVEFGTWKGNLSLYLYLYCLSEDAEFYTYDIYRFSSYYDEEKKDLLKEKLEFEKHFRRADVFKSATEIKEFLQQAGRSFLFCDNGKKTQEFITFAPFLKRGNIMGVHDWGTEVHIHQVEQVIKDNNLVFIFEEECLKNDKYIRFFKKM